MKRKRVFMISPFARPNLGGVESHLDKLIEALGRRQIEVTLLAYQPLVTDAQGSRIERFASGIILRVPRPGRNIWPRIEHNFALTFVYLVPGLLFGAIWYWFRSREKFDVIHCHGFSAAFVGWCLRLLGIRQRIVLSTHAIYRLNRRKKLAWLIGLLLKRMDFVLAVGDAARLELENIGVPSNRLGVHRNWVDIEIYKATDKKVAKANRGWSAERLHVLFVGRMLRIKGLEIVIALAEKRPDVQFHVFGAPGDMDAEVDRAADRLANFNIVPEPAETGIPRRLAVAAIYNAADLLLVPSIYEEGAATVVLEASACGTPILSSDLGCLPELIEQGINGWSVPPSPDSFSSKLAQIRADGPLLGDVSKTARRLAEERFSENAVEEIIHAYG